MSTFPSVTGSKLIKALRKEALRCFGLEGVTASFNIPMGDARLCRFILEKPWGGDFLRKY